MCTSEKMILLLFALLGFASLIGCDKLDRTYLPPPRSKFAGGSPGAILAPVEPPKFDQSIEGTTARPQLLQEFYTPTGSGFEQPSNQPGTGFPTPRVDLALGSVIQGTFPTTTTSYAFTQTTTYAPLTCSTPDCAIETSSQGAFGNISNYTQQPDFRGQSSNSQQGKYPSIRPGVIQPGTIFPQRPGAVKTHDDQQITSQYLPSYVPGSRQQTVGGLQQGPTFDGLARQPGQVNQDTFAQGPREDIQSTSQQSTPQTQVNVFQQSPYNIQQQTLKPLIADFISPSTFYPGSTILPGSPGQYSTKSPLGRTPTRDQSQYTVQQQNLRPQLTNYYRPDTQTSISDMNIKSGVQGQYSTPPSLVDDVLSNGIRNFSFQNVTSIPGYTSTLSPLVEQRQTGSPLIPSTLDDVSSRPFSGTLGTQTLITSNSINKPASSYRGPLLDSGFTPASTSELDNLPGQITPSPFRTSPQEIPGIKQSTSPITGFKQKRPVRPQADFERNAAIVSYENIITPEGFSYSFDTENGIHADESGTATDGVKAKGGFSYTGDDGKLYSIVYSADENGYQPIGDHLPTPPPIPEAILRVIEQSNRDKASGISDDGKYDENKYGYKKYQGVMDRYRPEKYKAKANLRGKLPRPYDSATDMTNEEDKDYIVSSTNGQNQPQRQQNQESITDKTSDQSEKRPSPDFRTLPQTRNYDDGRETTNTSFKDRGSQPTQYRDQQKQTADRRGGYDGTRGNTPEDVRYNKPSYTLNQEGELVQRPLRPQVDDRGSKIIGPDGKFTTDTFKPGYTASTFKPTAADSKRPFQEYERMQQFPGEQKQIYRDLVNEQEKTIGIRPDFERPSSQTKRPSDGYEYLPPSSKLEHISSTQPPNQYYTQQTQFPSTISTRRPDSGQTVYKLTTLRPFMTPRTPPAGKLTTSSDYDTDEDFSTVYPTSRPYQTTTFPVRKITTHQPLYENSNYTRTSGGPLNQYQQTTFTGKPLAPYDYQLQYQKQTESPDRYKQYPSLQDYSQGSRQQLPGTSPSFSVERDQNVKRPSDRYYPTTPPYPGQQNQDTSYSKNINQVPGTPRDFVPGQRPGSVQQGQSQYFPAQTTTQDKYTKPVRYGGNDYLAPDQELKSRVPSSKYSSTQSTIGEKKVYPQGSQYTQTVTQEQELPTTYRPSIESFGSSTVRPGYTGSPAEYFAGMRTTPGKIVIQNEFTKQPATDGTGAPRIQSGFTTTSSVKPDGEFEPGVSYGRDEFSGGTSPTIKRPEEERRKPGVSEVIKDLFDYKKPVSIPTTFEDEAALRQPIQEEYKPVYRTDGRPIVSQADRLSPSQTIKGEDFSRPKQPPRFDPETGYHY